MKASPQSLYIAIAGITIQIVFYPSTTPVSQKFIIATVSKQYRGFLTDTKPKKIDYRIEFVDINELKIQRKKNLYSVLFFEEKGTKTIFTYYHISIVHFYFIVRKILIKSLGERGFFLHSSASFVRKQAFLFVGRAEAGKTTAMMFLRKKHRPLADDHGLIKKEAGKFYYYQVPFFEKNQSMIKKSMQRYELGKLFFLKKARFFAIKNLADKNRILPLIMEQLWIDDEYLQQHTKVVFDFVKRFNKFFYLYFAKDEKKLIELIDRA